MIKAVIFDFFGVLVTERFKRFCDTFFPGDKEKRRQAVQLVTRHDAGIITQSQYFADLAKLAGVDLQTVREHMSSNKPNDPLLAYIRSFLKPKYKIGVLSNSGDDYISQILDPKDLKIFDDITLSYRHGLVKPQPEFFELAAARLGVLVTECVFIDDSASHCEGARAVGMHTIQYDNLAQMEDELEKLLAAVADN